MSVKKLKIIQSRIEEQFNRGSSSEWKNSDFIDLSHDIRISTGQLISPGTLKRIFGKVKVSDDYLPQPGVRKIIFTYLGTNEKEIWGNTISLKRSGRDYTNFNKIKPALYLVALLILLYAAFALLRNSGFLFPENYLFEVKDTIGKAYHTAVFNYKFDKQFQDEISIDFGDGNVEKLNLDLNTLTHYYRKPDHYKGVVFYRDVELDSFHVYLRTDGWEIYTTRDYEQGEEKRYYPVKIDFNDILNVTPLQIQSAGIDTSLLFYTHFCYYDTLLKTPDSINLSLRVKNSIDILQARCNHVVVKLVGEKEIIQLYFLKPGCTRWSRVVIAEKKYDGLYTDLSSFGIDFTRLREVKMNVKRRNTGNLLHVMADDQLVFSDKFSEWTGNILGIEIVFSGCGSLHSMTLNNLELFPPNTIHSLP